jgi:hypothetical protein
MLESIKNTPLSRRTVILGSIAGGASVLAGGVQAMTPSPVRVSRDSVHFETVAVNGHRCGECKLFIEPSSCVVVSGAITKDCGCRVWLPKAV